MLQNRAFKAFRSKSEELKNLKQSHMVVDYEFEEKLLITTIFIYCLVFHLPL